MLVGLAEEFASKEMEIHSCIHADEKIKEYGGDRGKLLHGS